MLHALTTASAGKKNSSVTLAPSIGAAIPTALERGETMDDKERDEHLAALRAAPKLHPDELLFLMQHGAESYIDVGDGCCSICHRDGCDGKDAPDTLRDPPSFIPVIIVIIVDDSEDPIPDTERAP